MIQFNNTIKQLLQQPVIESFYLVQVNLAGLTLKTTSFYTDLILSDGSTYLSDGRLLAVDPPKLSATVDRELYKITMADPDFSLGAYLEKGLVGVDVVVRVGFVNTATNLPLTDLVNTVIVYQGKVDSGSYAVSTEDVGETVFVLSCSSPMGDLDLTKYLQTTKDALRYIDATDTSFEQVYENAGQIELRWGKG